MVPYRVFLILAAISLGALVPLVVRDYWLHVTIIAYYYAVLTASWTLLAGYAGQFSFAHMALAGVGAYTSALVVLNTSIPAHLAVLIGSIAAACVGFLIGILVLRMRGPYLALFTIAYSELFRIVLNAEYKITRGNFGLEVPPLFASRSKVLYYYVMFAVLAASVLAMWTVVRSRYGVFLRAIREDEDAASAMAVDVVRYKVMAFMVSSFFAGLAGGLFGHYVLILTPNIMEIPQMGLIIAMAVIGGIESLAGAVAGAIIVEFVSEYLREFAEWRFVLFGLVLILTLRFSPNGLIYPLYRQLFRKKLQR